MAGGRPPKYKSNEELSRAIEAYFKKMDKEKRPYLVESLCLELDITRETFKEYGKNASFSDTIKKAKERIRTFAIESLWINRNTTGMIFNLKCNYGWTEKQPEEQKEPIKLQIEVIDHDNED